MAHVNNAPSVLSRDERSRVVALWTKCGMYELTATEIAELNAFEVRMASSPHAAADVYDGEAADIEGADGMCGAFAPRATYDAGEER